MFFTWFFDNKVFEYALLVISNINYKGWSLLVAIYLIILPSDKPKVSFYYKSLVPTTSSIERRFRDRTENKKLIYKKFELI